MPFLTEKIWLSIPHGDARPSLMVAQWPRTEELMPYADAQAERSIEMACALISFVRSTRARYQISPRDELNLVVRMLGDEAPALAEKLLEERSLIEGLANTALSLLADAAEKPGQSSVAITSDFEAYVILEGLVDFEKERTRLIDARTKTEGDLSKLEKKLANEGFLNKAAPEIVEKTRADAADARVALEQIERQLADLG
jgi:valyl-tRNA synthetase